jgi:hypothetical protein
MRMWHLEQKQRQFDCPLRPVSCCESSILYHSISIAADTMNDTVSIFVFIIARITSLTSLLSFHFHRFGPYFRIGTEANSSLLSPHKMTLLFFVSEM